MKKEPSEKEKKVEEKVALEPLEADKTVKKVEDKLEEVVEKEEEAEPKPERKEDKIRKRQSRREEMEKQAKEEHLANWKPKTKLGLEVKTGKIKDVNEIFNKGMKILEPEIVDLLIPNLKSDLLLIGQAKGKFGGGKGRFWRQTQRKTAEGNVPAFSCLIVIGDEKGHVGIGLGKARETLPAKEKAMRDAKLNLIRVSCGCGSFDCSCKDSHSIPFKVRGKVSSSVMELLPAPKGTGLAIERECKKILKLAGIKDVYSRTFGQTRTKINLAFACYNALKNTTEIKT